MRGIQYLKRNFFKQLKKLKIYKPNLRFTGFDGRRIGLDFSSRRGKDVIFCSDESDLFSGCGGGRENSLEYAFTYNKPAIAVYDGDKLEESNNHGLYGYIMKDQSALIAIILLK